MCAYCVAARGSPCSSAISAAVENKEVRSPDHTPLLLLLETVVAGAVAAVVELLLPFISPSAAVLLPKLHTLPVPPPIALAKVVAVVF